MPRKKLSLKAQIAEHEKYRRQCKVRIRPSLMLCAIAAGLYAILLWKMSVSWLGGLPLIVLPVFFTALEILGFLRHEKALKDLRSDRAFEDPTQSNNA